MPSDSIEILFTGESGVECEEFVQKVYTQAWDQDHAQDRVWMANYASKCFRSKALRWYVKLSPETRRDWELLQLALLERWPSEDDGAKPSPAAAVPPLASSSFVYKIGRLKAKVSGDDAAQWVSTETHSTGLSSRRGGLTLVDDCEKALHVQIIPLADQVCRLKMLNHRSGCSFIAMYILGHGSGNFGILIGVDVPLGEPLKGHRSTYSGIMDTYRFNVDVWSLSVKERALLIHSKAAAEYGGCIYLKKWEDTILLDDEPSPRYHPRLELFFEALDL